MRLVTRFALLAAVAATGCGSPAPSSPPIASMPTPAASWQPSDALYVENRGGPDLVFSVGGAPDVTVPCGGGYAFRPGEGGLSGPPWHVVARRASGGAVVLTGDVTGLPRWVVQIGDQIVSGGISATAILGPAVTCPPAG